MLYKNKNNKHHAVQWFQENENVQNSYHFNKTLINSSIFLNFWEIVISASISMYMYVWRFKTSLCASCSSVNSHGRISRHINLTDIHQVKHSCRKWSMSSKYMYYGTRKTRVHSINISLEKAHIFFKELV